MWVHAKIGTCGQSGSLDVQRQLRGGEPGVIAHRHQLPARVPAVARERHSQRRWLSAAHSDVTHCSADTAGICWLATCGSIGALCYVNTS